MFTKDKFMIFYKGTPGEKGASDCYDGILRALTSADILNDLTLIGALATCRVEVGRSFLPVIENRLFSTRYEFRKDLGNGKIGEGVKYRGRGYIQLTGKANYAEYGLKLGLDLVANPNLALKPEIASKILAQYFKDRAVVMACKAKDWVLVRRLVNGGTNGLTTFLAVVNQYISKNKNMETLEITKIERMERGVTHATYHRFSENEVSLTEKTTGTWEFEGVLSNEEVLEKAKTMVDSGIEVSLNLGLGGGQPTVASEPASDGSVVA